MDNLAFVDEENIQMVHDDDYDDYGTPDKSRVETSFIGPGAQEKAISSFTVPDATEATSTLSLRQKVKQDKVTALCRYLNVTGDIELIDLDRFRLTKNPKKGVTIFEFYNGDIWVPLTKQTGDFFCTKNFRG